MPAPDEIAEAASTPLALWRGVRLPRTKSALEGSRGAGPLGGTFQRTALGPARRQMVLDLAEDLVRRVDRRTELSRTRIVLPDLARQNEHASGEFCGVRCVPTGRSHEPIGKRKAHDVTPRPWA